jgi:hypothetical protein
MKKNRSGQRARRAKETIGRSAMSVHQRFTNQGRWRTSTKAITLEEYKRKNPGTVRDDAIEDEDQQRP